MDVVAFVDGGRREGNFFLFCACGKVVVVLDESIIRGDGVVCCAWVVVVRAVVSAARCGDVVFCMIFE